MAMQAPMWEPTTKEKVDALRDVYLELVDVVSTLVVLELTRQGVGSLSEEMRERGVKILKDYADAAFGQD